MQFLVPKASRWLLLLLQVYSLLRLVRSLGLVSDFGSCSTSANYTNGSQFQKNLNALLTSLVAKGPSKGYFVTDVGRYPDQVYGLVQCTGGVSATDCARCLQTASTEIVQSCPNGKDAYSFYEGCLLRYSNESFVSKLSESGKWMMMFNTQNISNPTRFNELLGDLLKNLSQKAPSDPSMFATGETKFTDFQNIYGFAQCSRDLSLDDCDTCLKDAITYIPGCCNGKQGARIISMSCNIRYEIYPFSESSRNPPPAPTGTGSAPNSSHPLEPITTTGRRRPSRFVVAITSAMAALGTALLVSCACYILRRKKTPKKVEKRETGHEDLFQDFGEETSTGFSYVDVLTGNLGKGKDLPLIDLATILAATDNFSSSNKLGQGGFGPVYKGKLIDGKEIAVKRLSRSSGQGVEEFKNEIILIAKLQHKNLVRLLCCCLEREEKLLIYEYMPNRSLDVFLFDPVRCLELDWERRFNIISGIARGLLYLHEDSRLKVIHRDLKASNILLDSQMNPKISDFGMARIFGVNQSEANTNRVVGTYGYMAPEYAMEGLFSVKSDVFSFGVLLLEIITGKKNGRFYLSGYAQSLLVYAWQLWSEGKAIELIDPLLAESCPTNEVLRYIHISLLCVQEDAADRPTMEKIVLMLSSDSVTLSQPKQPAFSVGRIIVSSNHSLERKVSSVNDVTISEFEPR